MENLEKWHWNAIKWILRCLSDTCNLEVLFEREGAFVKIVRYIDSNYVKELDSKTSIIRFLFIFVGESINWNLYYWIPLHYPGKG